MGGLLGMASIMLDHHIMPPELDVLTTWILSLIIACCAHYLAKPLYRRFFYSNNLHTLPGPDFEGLSIVQPFQDGAVRKLNELHGYWGPILAFKRRFAVRSSVSCSCEILN